MTNLLGGDVQLATDSARPLPEFTMDRRPSMLNSIHITGEHDGLYSYALNNKYTLRPSSSIRLPFLDIGAKYQFYYKITTGISSGTNQGVFERNYDITPDHFMPSGVITIHDNEILVGQAALPDVPENYTQTFTVGRDNDIRYLIKSNMTSKTDANATVQMETYSMDVQIRSFKVKSVDARLVLQGGVQVTVVDSTCGFGNVQGNELFIPVKLEQGESRECKFNLKVRLN